MSSPLVSTFALLGELVLVDVLVDDAGHRRAQAGQVRAAVALRDVVGEAEHLFVVAVVPLHRRFDGDPLLLGRDVEDGRMEDVLGAVDVVDEAPDAADEGEILFLVFALVDQLDLDAVVEEREFAQSLRQDLVVELDVVEDLAVGKEVDLGAARSVVPVTRIGETSLPLLDDDLAVLGDPALELHEVDLAVALDRQPQPLATAPLTHETPDPVQAARNLVAVLVELAAGMQLGHHDLGGTAPRLVLVVAT